MEIIYNYNDLSFVTRFLYQMHSDYKYWLFSGDMGVGKTSFIANLARQLGAQESVKSPSFSILNHYTLSNKIMAHLDLFRIHSEQELFELNLDDYLKPYPFVCIEWPFKSASWIKTLKKNLNLNFEIFDDNYRKITLKTNY